MIFGLDADVFHCLMQSYINGTECPSKNCFEMIETSGHIALDDSGFIKAQWEQTSAAHIRITVSDWITDRILEGTIVQYDINSKAVEFGKKPNEITKALMGQGVPRKDAKNVALLVICGAKIFFTNDTDLFDPTRKNKLTDRQFISLVINREGKVSKFCKKKYDLEIWHMKAMQDVAA